MPSLNLPARDVLRPRGATSIAWATFDADWYRATYATVPAGVSAEEVLEFYCSTGQGLGHSPNMLFDEAWHRRTYPEIAARVEAGEFASAFDASGVAMDAGNDPRIGCSTRWNIAGVIRT